MDYNTIPLVAKKAAYLYYVIDPSKHMQGIFERNLITQKRLGKIAYQQRC